MDLEANPILNMCCKSGKPISVMAYFFHVAFVNYKMKLLCENIFKNNHSKNMTQHADVHINLC